MAVTLLEAQDLVRLLHGGTLASEPWGDFLSALRRRADADVASIFLAGGGTGGGVVEFSAGKDQRLVEDTGLAGLAAHGSPLRMKRVMSLAEVMERADPVQSAALKQRLDADEVRFLRAIRVADPAGAALWLLIGRRERDFASPDTALLGTLADHLEIALRTWSTIEQERVRAGITADAIRRLNFGWFLLNLDGMIVDHSDEAEALLHERRGVLRGPRGGLIPQLREAEGALRRYLAEIAKGETASRAIHLSDEPWLDMLLTPRKPPRSAAAPMVAAYVHGEQPSSSERSAQLAELFGLTAKEAQLALLISRGVKIAEAASQLGLTVESARLYSKRIYAKTGTRGQADLVRLVLASIVALT